MTKETTNRERWLTVRLNDEEYDQIEALRRQTTCNSLSEYARKSLLGKPVIMKYRNQSLDEFVTGMIRLQNELNAIGRTFNQAIRRLHSARQLSDVHQWIMLNEQDKTRLFRQIDAISEKINQAYQLWSRE